MRVFISYTHDSEEHKDRVWELSAALRNDGIDCTIDEQLFSPPEGWPRWSRDQIHESQFVLVVATETYKRRYEGKDEPGKGLGAKWEGFVITQELYETEGKNSKFIPIVFSREDAYHIPLELQGATRYDLGIPANYDRLFRHLTNQPARVVPPVAPQIRRMPPIGAQLDIRFKPLLARERQVPKRSTDNTGSLMVNIFDGTRQLIGADTQILLRIIDGNQKQILNQFYTVPNILIKGLPIYNNFGDNYTVLASAKGYKQAGFVPVKMLAGTVQSIDLMLLPSNGNFNFRDALWPTLKQTHPNFAAILAQGAADDNAAQDRYTQLMENEPASLASFLNLATAMSAINLPEGTPLDYIKGVIWDNTFAQDRFFGWSDPKIIDQIITATLQGEFAPEPDPSIFHGTATRSWKHIQFGEANVQLTFHENDPTMQIDGINCVKIEPSIDYYKELAAHFLLEVAVNAISHTITDPKQVYVLRWMADRHAGVPNFNPPYVIV
jgi:hypothetical protein